MTGAVLKMNTFVRVTEGMRVYYDCPAMSGEDFQSDRFFKQNRGKTGAVKGFPEKFVGPLDSKGRLPGVYIKPGYIHVQFEGEEEVHKGLNLDHFILLDVGQTVVPTENLGHQKVRDLPKPIKFWPGDSVRKEGGQKVRLVEDVRIDDKGTLTYILAETPKARQRRQAKKEAEIARRRKQAEKSKDSIQLFGLGLASMDFPRTEHCKGGDLVLVARGNVYHLYHDPAKLIFGSVEDEVAFWAKDGISRTVYGNNNFMPRWEWPLKDARQMVEKGEGDLVVASKQYKNVVVEGRGGDFEVRKLLHCFAEHRERVRALSLSLAKPPVEEEIPFAKGAMALLGDD